MTTAQTPVNTSADRKILLLRPRGFCAGVVRAIDVVKIALDLYEYDSSKEEALKSAAVKEPAKEKGSGKKGKN